MNHTETTPKKVSKLLPHKNLTMIIAINKRFQHDPIPLNQGKSSFSCSFPKMEMKGNFEVLKLCLSCALPRWSDNWQDHCPLGFGLDFGALPGLCSSGSLFASVADYELVARLHQNVPKEKGTPELFFCHMAVMMHDVQSNAMNHLTRMIQHLQGGRWQERSQLSLLWTKGKEKAQHSWGPVAFSARGSAAVVIWTVFPLLPLAQLSSRCPLWKSSFHPGQRRKEKGCPVAL
jgi:hypothetical protein